ncbi:MAG: serine/threonine protein kinase [Candidatus Bathyarchaeota archaeon]|nr:serine/threonine protein kinase [Candidatus Bathyarchaeota archaeon]
MSGSLVVPVEHLVELPYAVVLCYPKPDLVELRRRVQELQCLGVDAVEFSGCARAHAVPFPLLGKGFVGVVVVAFFKGQRVALKIRRVDADRPDMFHEAQMLAKANTADAGPKLLDVSPNFLLMQLIDGNALPRWLETQTDPAFVRRVLAEVLEQCYRLDLIGLDHGELSKAPKHVLVDRNQNPYLVDFETASDNRKTVNVTALSHFLFTSNGKVSCAIAEILGERNKEEIVAALQAYRKDPSRSNFDAILSVALSG